MSEAGEILWRASHPDYYRSLRRRLPMKDLLYRLIMHAPMERIEEILVWSKSRSVLDVGCGTGLLGRTLSERGFDVTGLDVSRTMIQRARKVAPQIRLDWQDAAVMEYANDFDAAVLSLCLHEMSAAARARSWQNARRAVVNGGILIVLDYTEPGVESLPARLIRSHIERGERSFDRVNPEHYTNYRQFMSAGGLREWLGSVGADVDAETDFMGTNLGLFVVRP